MRRLIMATALLATACGGEKKAHENPPTTPPATKAAGSSAPTITNRELADALRAANAVPTFGGFQVEEISDAAVKLSHLSDEGGTRDEVQALATRLVVATIDVLKKRGANPHDRHTAISAEVLVTAPDSVSGGGRAALLGRATYDADADDVGFEAPPDAPFNPPSSGDANTDAARIAVHRYTCEAFPVWERRNPGACPKRLDELNQLARRRDSKDPWGAPYQMACGDELPAGSRTMCGGAILPGPPIAVMSHGPDRKPGTTDDVRSWD